MKHITKSDNEKMVISEKTIVLYDNITEVQTEDGVQYEADMYVVKNRGNIDYESLLAKAKAVEAQELQRESVKKAYEYLSKTDWVVVQLGEYQMLGKEIPDRDAILKKREEAREIIRNA